MRREKQLKQRLRTLRTLSDAVTAMKSLSAHHFLLARRSLDAARQYRSAVDDIIDELALEAKQRNRQSQGILLITSDFGLCGDYNSLLTARVLKMQEDHHSTRLFVVGRRGKMMLAKHSVQATREYAAPASVNGLPACLLEIAEDVVGEYSEDSITNLDVISARFTGAGKFAVATTNVLPISPNNRRTNHVSTNATMYRYQSRQHLWQTVIREYLYITLYQLILESLVSEHGMRLVSAETARQWIEETEQSVRRQLSAARRENSTQEILDIVSASRKKNRT